MINLNSREYSLDPKIRLDKKSEKIIDKIVKINNEHNE